MKEIWKDIPNYEDLYQISNLGNVKSVGRRRFNSGTYGGYFTVKEKILKPSLHKNGYYSVQLCKNGGRKRITIHKLVATVFIPNPNNYPQINHKDENKTNNSVENLEWCDSKYNSNYGTRNERLRTINQLKYSKFVLQYDLNNVFIKRYRSIGEASRETNISRKCISYVCNHQRKTAGGYKWVFE